jgi:hypothetical protein
MRADDRTARPLQPGSKLHALTDADGRVVWRPQYTRNPVVLAVLHGEACERCAEYRDELIAARPDFDAWDGQLFVAEPGEGREEQGRARGDATHHGAVTVPDPIGGAPRVVVADRFGDVYHVQEGGPAHELPEPRALEEWLRFIATQCPE